ncbi:unnamed protein product, partial [Dicrocoelium dendriticum]
MRRCGYQTPAIFCDQDREPDLSDPLERFGDYCEGPLNQFTPCCRSTKVRSLESVTQRG